MRLSVALLLTLAVTAGACSDDGQASCIEVREPLDPMSLQHVIDTDDVIFLTDPPTSGPHLNGPAIVGVRGAPLEPAAQVRVLEAGGVLVQYSEPATEDDLRFLIDGGDVAYTITPGDSLPDTVVATAWTWKLTCPEPDLDRIREFAELRALDAPGLD